jgi:hypothetical protein
MPSRKEQHLPPNQARRHFLGLAAATGAKVAVIGAAAASIVPPTLAQAMGRRWWKKEGGNGGHSPEGQPMCFLGGTLISTPRGEVCIENLQIGDRVETVRGTPVQIKWIGRHVYKRSTLAWDASIVPIRVARHALDQTTPHRDLYLSPGHALLIDGVLIRVKDLVNGLSIAPSPPANSDMIEYFHIVLDTHEVIFAEGAPAETFLVRQENHESFTNFAEFARLYPSHSARPAMTPFAPFAGMGGRKHLKALLRLGASQVFPGLEPEPDVYDRIAARAEAMIR